MRIIWVQDLNPLTETGGAQLNDREKIISGIRRGHDIEVVLPPGDKDLANSADAVIISNASAFPVQLFRELVSAGKPYVFFLHDMWPLCKWRLYYAQLPKCKSCYRKDTWMDILKKSRLIVWLSPMHRQAWLYACPELRGVPYLLNPSTVNPDQFYDMSLSRSGALAVNAGLAFKGRDMLIEYAEAHQEEKITLLGPAEGRLPGNIVPVGVVPYSGMNLTYNQHEKLLHLPVHTMPFDRVVVEALLAGCKVYGNRNIGALSWKFMHQGQEIIRQAMRRANLRFWENVEMRLWR